MSDGLNVSYTILILGDEILFSGWKGASMQTANTFTTKNGQEVTIRPARPDDASGIIDSVRSHAFERSYVLMEHYSMNTGAEREYITGLDTEKNLLAVASSGDEIVGCLAALQADGGKRPETAHVLRVGLHLKEPFRGIGIGPNMLAYALTWAVEKKFKKAEANIFTTNKRSLTMFKQAGFIEEGVRQNRIRMGRDFISEVLMGKMLCT
jgi:L-amino acid N-acyltransferase YncA